MTPRPLALIIVAVVALAPLVACGSDGGAQRSATTAARPSGGSTGSTAVAGPRDFPAVDSPGDDGSLDKVKVTAGDPVFEVDHPTKVVVRPSTGDLYIAERDGRIRVATKATSGDYRLQRSPALDISRNVSTEGERGLLGLAFSSDGRTIYVSYTNADGNTRLDQYGLRDDRIDTGTKRTLLAVDQPFPNHNGGDVVLGSDGYLYFGLGDGGSADDPGNRAQDTSQLLGKILRIDPQGGTADQPYTSPPGNPFQDGSGGRPEIYLYGVRNPWRFSFDATSGDLWIGDVGQNEIEEIDHFARGQGAGANLGWSGYEGTHLYQADRAPEQSVPPVYEYDHSDGRCSVIGGVVYRGSAIPALRGAYLFSDNCDGKLRALRLSEDGTRVVAVRDLGVEVPQLVSIDQGEGNEVWLVSLEGGVYRLS